MLEKIQHIDPQAITDFVELQNLMTVFMNVVENQAQQIDSLVKENQALRDEINRLKGEHGDLPPKVEKPSSPSSSKKAGEKKSRQKNNKRGRKNPKIVVDKTMRCKIDKTLLPPDARFQGYRKVIQQDILIQRNNTLYQIPIYYSKTEKRTYSGDLPAEYQGEFGGELKSWIQLLHHYGDMTQGRLKAMLKNLGIHISTGTISNIILSNRSVMESESQDILQAGLERIPFTQMDGTKSWEKGKGKSTQIISTPAYSVYYTMDSKSKVDIIWALQGKNGQSAPLAYNDLAVELLQASDIPKKDQRLLAQLLVLNHNYLRDELEEILQSTAPQLLEKSSYPKLLELLALAYYFTQTDFKRVENLISDAGPEYIGIAAHQSLCWLHEERHYKKMIPKLSVHQTMVDKVRDQIWTFYAQLLNFKTLPPDEQQLQRPILRQEFDTIFTQKTVYDDLNDRIEKTFAKKEKLLRVLDAPQIPLHNNGAELAVRRKVRKRDISLHTMCVKGTQAQDAFMSVVETAAKLGVNALDYLYDRITNKYQMTPLAELIRTNTLAF